MNRYEVTAFLDVWADSEEAAMVKATTLIEIANGANKDDLVDIALDDGPPLLVDWEGAI